MKAKIINYLLGSNKNLLGTILGFSRNINPKESIHSLWTSPQLISFILFFDHRTGRIERFLINEKSKKDVNTINNLKTNEFKEDTLINNKEYRYINEEPHIIDPVLSFKLLHDGKLNKHFINSFLFELYRDYLTFENSFKNCDMNYLRLHTLPIQHKIFNEEGKVDENGTIQFPVGTGIKNTELTNVKGTNYFKAKRFVELDRNKNSLINVPEKFKTNYCNNISLNYNIELISNKINKNSPESVLDLKRRINGRNITSTADLQTKVLEFNKLMFKKLSALQAIENKE